MSGGLGFFPSTVGPILEGYVTTLGYGELLYVFRKLFRPMKL